MNQIVTILTALVASNEETICLMKRYAMPRLYQILKNPKSVTQRAFASDFCHKISSIIRFDLDIQSSTSIAPFVEVY